MSRRNPFRQSTFTSCAFLLSPFYESRFMVRRPSPSHVKSADVSRKSGNRWPNFLKPIRSFCYLPHHSGKVKSILSELLPLTASFLRRFVSESQSSDARKQKRDSISQPSEWIGAWYENKRDFSADWGKFTFLQNSVRRRKCTLKGHCSAPSKDLSYLLFADSNWIRMYALLDDIYFA